MSQYLSMNLERNERKVNDIKKMILCVKGQSKGENTIVQSRL